MSRRCRFEHVDGQPVLVRGGALTDTDRHYIGEIVHAAQARLAKETPTMTNPQPPLVGDTVHYVSNGTPHRDDGTQAFPSVCRAAIVTEVTHLRDLAGTLVVGLAVLNPTGQFFDTGLHHHPGDTTATEGALCTTGTRTYPPGTWHHPEPHPDPTGDTP